MGCREWGTDLTDWALDELSPQKARQLEQHIEQCAECARSAQGLRGLRQALMSGLTDREMPAHLVLVEKSQKVFAGFWTSLLRTAALSATAAAIFLVVASVGFRYGGSRLLPSTARAELQAYVAHMVADQASLQRKETQAATQDLAATLRQEQTGNLARIVQELQYLELAQNTVWKETRQQNAVMTLLAHNYSQPPASSSAEPSRR
jgi:hypothetical protein